MPKINVHPAELLLDTKSGLGEGPVWDLRRQVLFWVDIEGKRLLEYDPSNGNKRHWDFQEMVGAVVPMDTGGLLLALESCLATFDPTSNTMTKQPVLQNNNPMMRLNDGKVGPDGRFYIGSMHKKFNPGRGSLYQVTTPWKSVIKVPGTSISNGMAWSADARTFYFIDSPTFEVLGYDFDPMVGNISNGRPLFKVPQHYGSPDGMCIDSEGKLWIAHWGGSCIRRWDPATGKVLASIQVAAPNVTSCCFGGKDLKTLYITTALSGLDKNHLQKYPHSGGLFVHRANVRGTPINYFK